MGGRQAHGRSLMPSGSGPGNKRKQQRSKARSSKKALDAFSIANREVGEKTRMTPRNRELDAEVGGGKRGRRDEDDDGDEDDEDEDEAPPRKVMRRGGAHDQEEQQDVEYGSDSSGNEWRIGVGADDDDSELDSDEAFGESDDERFQGYAFGASKKKRSKGQDNDNDDDEDDDDEADGESLGSDAIDLAAALDQYESSSDAEGQEGEEDSDDESGPDDSESDEESVESNDDDVSETGVNDWVKKFSGVADEDEEENAAPQKTKIDLKDLGLLGLSDPQLKKSLKMMSKEEKTSKPQKLEIPLARRQQAQLERAAASEQANKTLDRWNETVKQNRRAEHLVFPLAQTETGLARHDNSEIAPINRQAPNNELERTILGIMEESGLGPKAEAELVDEDGETISRKELQSLWQAKRRERELKSREEARAKRIKKIKSKAYHRVHRKERERNEIKEHEAMVEAGEVDSEDEREARDRQRAAERMGARHKDSKWAKMAKKGGLAVWDDSVREGMADMARRDQELRRRVEGRGQESDNDSDYSGDSEDADDRKHLLKQLQEIQDSEDAPSKSKLMNMAFMQKAEAAKRKENDELIAQIRRDLASDDEEFDGSEPEADDIGRRRYGVPGAKKEPTASGAKKQKSKRDAAESSATASASQANAMQSIQMQTVRELAAQETGGAWSSAAPAKSAKKQRGKKTDTSANVLDLDSSVAVVKAPQPAAKSRSSKQQHATAIADDASSDDEDGHIIQFREQDLLDKAFGGLDVVADFEAEKRVIEEDDDDKVIDNTLPGWGSWVGDGVSAREKKRHQGRFLTKKEGVQKDKRKDAKLDKVIISEKHHKKNTKYLASQLPHMYESHMQYERSLRVPVGPEWVTKKTHQEATKPRIMLKQGIIAPMAKPMQ